ncbi:unnamed protein product [Fusarium langsethiae]|nr:unnamed protein product [Fusarium langsethiae]
MPALPTPGGSRPASPNPDKKPLFPEVTEEQRKILNGTSPEALKALLDGLTQSGTTPATHPPASTAPAGNPPAGNPPAGNPPAVTAPAVTAPASNPPAVNLPAGTAPVTTPPVECDLTTSEMSFLDLIGETLPELGTMCMEDSILADHIQNGCKQFKQATSESIVHFLLNMEYQASKNEDTYQMKQAQEEYLKDPKPWNQINFGNDAALMSTKAEKALETLAALDKMQHGPPSIAYNSAERRHMRRGLRATPADLKADFCTITDPETKEKVEAEIIGRHPHRRKWLVCALASRNPQFPFVQRVTSIDGSSSEYRDILERYALHGSDHTIPVGGKEDLQDCNPEDFEQNAVILLPWGKGFRLSSYGYPHNKNREFKLFPKTVITSKWGMTTGLEIMHGHLQKCGTPIPQGKDGEDLNRLKVRTWGM